MPTNPHNSPAALLAANPLSKVPCLMTDDGVALFDSPVICEYLDSLEGAPPVFPRAGPARWKALKLQAIGDGIMDAAVLRRGLEAAGGPPDAVRATRRWRGRRRRWMRALDLLERDLPHRALDIGTITVGLRARLSRPALRRRRLARGPAAASPAGSPPSARSRRWPAPCPPATAEPAVLDLADPATPAGEVVARPRPAAAPRGRALPRDLARPPGRRRPRRRHRHPVPAAPRARPATGTGWTRRNCGSGRPARRWRLRCRADGQGGRRRTLGPRLGEGQRLQGWSRPAYGNRPAAWGPGRW